MAITLPLDRRMPTPIPDARTFPSQQAGTAGKRGVETPDASDAEWAVALVREAVAVLFASPRGTRPDGAGDVRANDGRPGLWDRGGRAAQPSQAAVR